MIEPDLNRLVLVVVGAHLRAELNERALAQQLRDVLEVAIHEKWDAESPLGEPESSDQPRVVVVTDLWRMQDADLAPLPQVSVGHPELNALSAFLVDKIPPAFVIDGELAVQFDAASPEAIAVCWGTDHRATGVAVAEFTRRYLDAFADAVVRELRA
jgi:hypothetical protein